MNATATQSAVRVPPQNIEAEQSVLGAMLLSRDAIAEVFKILSVEDFYRESHRRIFECIATLAERGEPADMIMTTNELRKNGNYERVGGLTGLMALVERTPTAANVEYYANIVRQKAIARTVIHSATRLVSAAYQDEPTEQLLDRVQSLSTQAQEGAAAFREYDDSMETLVARVKNLLEANWAGKRDWFIPTGFPHYDETIGGFERKKLTLFTGDEGIGKSALLQQMAVQMAQQAVMVGYVNLDTEPDEIPLRLACNWVQVDYRDLASRDPLVLGEAKKRAILGAFEPGGVMAGLHTLKVVGQEHIGFSFDRFEDWAKQRAREVGLKVIFLDSAAKFDLATNHDTNTEQAMSRMINRLKFLAADLDVAMVTIHETNQSEDKSPKHSGTWKFAARYWFHLFRDEDDGRLIRIRIRKNSNGRRDYNLAFRQDCQFKLREIEPSRAEQTADNEDQRRDRRPKGRP